MSNATIIYNEKPLTVSRALTVDNALWLELGEMKQLTGWEVKTEGACLGEVCVPLQQRDHFVMNRDGRSWFNFSGLADLLDKPWAGDPEHQVWYFGSAAAARAEALRSLKAPDFTLPDVDGKLHSLSDHLGKKVFIVSWASW